MTQRPAILTPNQSRIASTQAEISALIATDFQMLLQEARTMAQRLQGLSEGHHPCTVDDAERMGRELLYFVGRCEKRGR